MWRQALASSSEMPSTVRPPLTTENSLTVGCGVGANVVVAVAHPTHQSSSPNRTMLNNGAAPFHSFSPVGHKKV